MKISDAIKNIKTELRLAMNGTASTFMRESGIHYKLNFGVELPRIQSIAKEFIPEHQLAQALWKENIRECKILAGMLQPTESFCAEIADIWIEDIHTVELAQLTVVHLFQHLPYASEKAFQWIACERDINQICGFLILARFFMRGLTLNERAENEYLDQAEAAFSSQNIHVRRAIVSSLQKFEIINPDTKVRIRKILQHTES